MRLKNHIPNTITCGNLVCGCLGILSVANGDLTIAAMYTAIALVLDFFDGFAARLLKVASPIGKDLDSLADMVTFGVLPGLVMFKLIGFSVIVEIMEGPAIEAWASQHQLVPVHPLQYVALLIPVLSAVRLAKFNNDTRQSESFIGVPTPANAIFIASLPLILAYNSGPALKILLLSPYMLTGIAVVMSFLLIAPIPLFALKFKNFGWGGNEIRFIFLALCVLLLVLLGYLAVPLIILLYVALSMISRLSRAGSSA